MQQKWDTYAFSRPDPGPAIDLVVGKLLTESVFEPLFSHLLLVLSWRVMKMR